MSSKDARTTIEFSYHAIFEPAEEGGYAVRFPAIPGLVTEGRSLAEARAMANAALRCFIEGIVDDGLAIPPSDVADREPIYERVSFELRTP